MSLGALIDDEATSITDIAALLDGMSHEQRREAVEGLKSKQVRELYWRAASAPPLTLDCFVPSSVPPKTEVIHWGRNSLPAFNYFQKRFCRGERPGELYGYNEQSMRWVTGPGFFVAHDSQPDHTSRGAVVVNYHKVPEAQADVVEGWPNIWPNSRGLQLFIYYKTRDFMRRVSSHVSVGAAFRNESDKEMGAYFALVREDR